MLRTLSDKEKSNWKDALNKIAPAYNRARSSATGYSPLFLMFGRKPKLPIDSMFDQPACKLPTNIPSVSKTQRSHDYHERSSMTKRRLICPLRLVYLLEIQHQGRYHTSFVPIGKT